MIEYNLLPSVEDANKALGVHAEFQTFLREFADVALRYDVHELVGICLLHRHFTLLEDESIIEQRGHWQHETALISSPSAASLADAAPSAWKFDENELPVGLEYSVDPAVGPTGAAMTPDFLTAVYQLLRDKNLQDLLGITVLPRDTLPLESGSQYFEETWGHQSVVTLVPEGTNAGSITTVWAAGDFMGCTVYNTCHSRNVCNYANEQHRNVLSHVTERGHHRPGF